MAKYAVVLAIAVVGLALVLDLLYLLHGSLEPFPTEEQQAKVRLATGVLAALLAAIEVGLWFLLRRMRARSAWPASGRQPLADAPEPKVGRRLGDIGSRL